MNTDDSERPTWNEYFKNIALLTATRSACKRLHVGCLLVKDNRIIAQGYNGYLPGCKHDQIMRDGHEIATVTETRHICCGRVKKPSTWFHFYLCFGMLGFLIFWLVLMLRIYLPETYWTWSYIW